MLSLPRVAVGTVQPGADYRAILWALIESFRVQGLQVQSFLSQASFARYHGTATASGLSPRHLDSWLMPRELCREFFVRGAECFDLALVHGKFADRNGDNNGAGGSLDELCDWLELPRLVVLDASRVGGQGLPQRPPEVDGVLLDRVIDRHHLSRLTGEVESLWRVPAFGGMEVLAELRAAVDRVPAGNRPPRELCQRLGGHFWRRSRPERIVEMAFRRGMTWRGTTGRGMTGRGMTGRGMTSVGRQCAAVGPAGRELTVALAYDAALNCYFPDVLDALEARGARILDFSPLRDERLPEGTDLAYLGCGHPERYAVELSQNQCMKLALRDHLRNGGRIYAEGGGLAYLCQQIEIGGDDCWRMVGIFPAVARLIGSAGQPQPVEVALDCDTWLAPRGTRLRGYRNLVWQLEPTGPLAACVAQPGSDCDLVRSWRAIGSRLHLDFAVRDDLLGNFFQPLPTRGQAADPWTVSRQRAG